MAIFDQHIDDSLLDCIKSQLNHINQTAFDIRIWPLKTYCPNTWLINKDELIVFFENFWRNIYVFGAGDDLVTPCLYNPDLVSGDNPGSLIQQKYAECGIQKFDWAGRFQSVILKDIPVPNISHILHENHTHIRRCEEIILDKIEPDTKYTIPGYPRSIAINDAGMQYGPEAAKEIASEFARRQFFDNMRLTRVTAYIMQDKYIQFAR